MALLLAWLPAGWALAQDCPRDVDQDGHVDAACPGGDDCDDQDPFVHPGADERCNGVDDDCDGLADEDWPALGEACDGPDPDACPDGALACAPDEISLMCAEEGPGRLEACNGLDDDCDGLTDEDWPELGEACDGPDGDLCARGAWVCAASGQTLECLETDSGDGQELCNGLDDDCDGLTDEDLGLHVCGLGVCQVSVPACLDGVPQACTPLLPTEPGQELSCEDGLDNDCDGFADLEDVADCGEGGDGGCGCGARSGAGGVALALPALLLLLGLALAWRRRRSGPAPDRAPLARR
jgi:hypothetical protein